MCLAVLPLRWDPCLNVVLLYLPETKIASAVHDHTVGNFQFLHDFLRDCSEFLVILHALFVTCFAENNLFEFEKFMHTHDTLGVFAVTSGLSTETRRESDELLREIL